MPSAETTIGRHVSSCLSHEPDRRVRGRLAPGCAEQRRIVEGHIEEGTYRRQPNASPLPRVVDPIVYDPGPMAYLSGEQAFLQILRQEGVRVMFGNPGRRPGPRQRTTDRSGTTW